MICEVKHGSLTEHVCDALIVNLFEGVRRPGGGTGAVDRALGGAISELIADEHFEGKLGQTAVIPTYGKIPAKKVVLVGLGKSSEFGFRETMRAAGAAARKCRDVGAANVGSILHGAGIGGLEPFECAKATALGTALGCYRFTRWKTSDVAANPMQRFEIVELSADKIEAIKRGVERAKLLAEAITFARDLVNEPSNVATPSYLADIARRIAQDAGFECKILDRAGIEVAGFGLIAAVARGSREEPRLIELRYQAEQASKTIALIGKGVTFDTGGHSLKRSEDMSGMKDDMAGAAAVVAAMKAIGQARPRVNVIAIIPAVENAIGSGAIHPGDVFKSYSGKTVEIANTDAEGRLLLGDAIAYAVKLGVNEIIDVATLTWACVVALGEEISGVFGTDQKLVDRILAASRACGEQLWQMPLYAPYRKKLDSEVADIKNVNGVRGAAIVAAEFLRDFTDGVSWAHIDLSGATVGEDNEIASKGATGAATGTLIECLLSA